MNKLKGKKRNLMKYIEYSLLLLTLFLYYFSLIFEFSWKISWFFLTLTTLYILIIYSIKALKGEVVYDKLLFILGLIVFIIYEPASLIFSTKGFPDVNNTYINDDYVANFVGFMTVVYIYSFYLGHMLTQSFYSRKKMLVFNKGESDELKPYLLIFYFIIACLPFFIFGSSSIVENFLFNLNARANGYVAFASGGLGSKNPIISLLAQSIPATIILLAIYMDKISNRQKIIVFIFMMFLFFLYISLGGRSGVIFVFMSIAIFWYLRRKVKTIPVSKIFLILFLIFAAMTYQINTRDSGNFTNTDKSGMTGFDLNRELTFIVRNYGLNNEYLSANNIIEQITLPIIETVYLFVTNPIPRILWKDKPIDESFAPYNKLRTGKTGFESGSNITPTIQGRYYMKYGLVGVIEIGIFIGILWTIANNLIRENLSMSKLKLIIPIAFAATLFSTTRDFAPGKFYPFLFIYLFYILNNIKVRK